MATKYCKECGAEISDKAKQCPKCGAPIKNHTAVRVIVGIVLICLGCSIIAGGSDTTQNTDSTSTSTTATLEKFNQIENGMTYEEVADIVGSEGTLSTESGYGDASYEIYYWYSDNGISNMTVSFMNGVVTAKSQIGLD